MQDLKDLKRRFYVNDRGGQAPALRYAVPPPFHRRAGACPSPCYRAHERSRGTGPRATVSVPFSLSDFPFPLH